MVRAFIAIELPPSIQQSIDRYLKQLQTELLSVPVRWVPVKHIHLTLKFLGDIPAEFIAPTADLLKQVAVLAGDFELGIRSLGVFPNARRPRVLWLGVEEDSGQLNHLQGSIDTVLEQLKFKPESRRFHPHLTIGRVKQSARPGEISALAGQLDQTKQPHIGAFKAGAVHLIQSDLQAQGPIYTRLASAPLGDEQ